MPDRKEYFTVEKSLPGGRLDVFLRTKFPAASRGALQRLIEQGHIRVNGQTTKPTHSPRAGEEIESTGRRRGPPRRSRSQCRSIFCSKTNRCWC